MILIVPNPTFNDPVIFCSYSKPKFDCPVDVYANFLQRINTGPIRFNVDGRNQSYSDFVKQFRYIFANIICLDPNIFDCSN